jgi:hypothetical protein
MSRTTLPTPYEFFFPWTCSLVGLTLLLFEKYSGAKAMAVAGLVSSLCVFVISQRRPA